MAIIHALVHHIADAISGHNGQTQQTPNPHGGVLAIPHSPAGFLPLASAHPCRGCCRRERRRARRDCRRSHWCTSSRMTPVYQTHHYQQQQQQPPSVHVTVQAPEMVQRNIHSSHSNVEQESGVVVQETELPPAYTQGPESLRVVMPEKQ